MKNRTRNLATATLLCLLVTSVRGQDSASSAQQESPIQPTRVSDTIIIPVGRQSRAEPAIALPARGLNQAAVLARFGEPIGRSGPTGVPPISRWNYKTFVVYFEGDTVLHSVVNFQPHNPSAAK